MGFNLLVTSIWVLIFNEIIIRFFNLLLAISLYPSKWDANVLIFLSKKVKVESEKDFRPLAISNRLASTFS